MTEIGRKASANSAPTWTRDELILACDLVYQNDWRGLDPADERVRELSHLLQQLPIHPMRVRGPKFRNLNSVARKSYDLATHHPDYTGKPTKGGAGDIQVLHDFLDDGPFMHKIAQAIRVIVESDARLDLPVALEDVDEAESEAREGRLLERRHLIRERDRKLRDKKIKEHLRTNTDLACSICDFDFRATYGAHGDGYIECHHVVPLSASGVTTTRLKDLILICANCHRMIHRRSPWLEPEQLRGMLQGSEQP